MASIIKRGPYQYQATVRRRGYKTQCKTFESRADAEAWAQAVESSMHRGKFRDPSGIKQITLEQALRLYEEKVTAHKKRPQQERSRINKLCRHPMAQRYIAEMRACDFAEYRDERLKQVGANTVRLELALLSHLYTIAIKEWSWPLEHEVRNVRKPKPPAVGSGGWKMTRNSACSRPSGCRAGGNARSGWTRAFALPSRPGCGRVRFSTWNGPT